MCVSLKEVTAAIVSNSIVLLYWRGFHNWCTSLSLPNDNLIFYFKYNFKSLDLPLIHSTSTFQTFTVSTGSSSSTLVDISCGIPQGPSFGLFPFCLSMLPLGSIIRTHNISCHCADADGTQIPPLQLPKSFDCFYVFLCLFVYTCLWEAFWCKISLLLKCYINKINLKLEIPNNRNKTSKHRGWIHLWGYAQHTCFFLFFVTVVKIIFVNLLSHICEYIEQNMRLIIK